MACYARWQPGLGLSYHAARRNPFASARLILHGLWFGEDATNPDLYERRAKWIGRLKDGGAIKNILDATQARFETEPGLTAPRRIVLNVNQSEELYSLTPDALREPFSRLLVAGLNDPRLRVLASLRSDYYGNLQANKPLQRSVRLDVLPFDAEGLKTAIKGPARVLGARSSRKPLPISLCRAPPDRRALCRCWPST